MKTIYAIDSNPRDGHRLNLAHVLRDWTPHHTGEIIGVSLCGMSSRKWLPVEKSEFKELEVSRACKRCDTVSARAKGDG
jgi:hypothetical protein